MKKFIAMIVALALSFSLMACSSDTPEAQPTERVTVTATPTPTETVEPPANKDEVFLSVVRDEYYQLETLPDSDIVGLATSACDALDSGASIEQVVTVIAESSNDPEIQEALGFVVGAGIATYCPEYTHLIEGYGTSAS